MATPEIYLPSELLMQCVFFRFSTTRRHIAPGGYSIFSNSKLVFVLKTVGTDVARIYQNHLEKLILQETQN